MDEWSYKISVACYGIWVHTPLISVGVVQLHLPFPDDVAYAYTNIQQVEEEEEEEDTSHILAHGIMPGCGLPSLVVTINDKIHDIRDRNVTIGSEIWTTNIRSLGLQDMREWVILWGLILQSLGCIVQILGC